MQASAVLTFWRWQLPTYDGAKSYQNLLVGVYGGQESYNWPNTHMDAILHNGPINLIRSGYYYYSSGGLSARSGYGYYWEATSYSATLAGLLYFASTYLRPQTTGTKGYGFTVRCLVR